MCGAEWGRASTGARWWSCEADPLIFATPHAPSRYGRCPPPRLARRASPRGISTPRSPGSRTSRVQVCGVLGSTSSWRRSPVLQPRCGGGSACIAFDASTKKTSVRTPRGQSPAHAHNPLAHHSTVSSITRDRCPWQGSLRCIGNAYFRRETCQRANFPSRSECSADSRFGAPLLDHLCMQIPCFPHQRMTPLREGRLLYSCRWRRSRCLFDHRGVSTALWGKQQHTAR